MNFVDPSGHEPKYGCYSSENGKCTNADSTPIINGNGKGGNFLDPWEVPVDERLDYVKTLAIRYKIELPEGSDWAYYPNSGEIGDWYRGLTVFDDGILSDGNLALEDYAYITTSAFANPASPPPGGFVVTTIKEFVSILAHEAEHVWQDYYFDNGQYTNYPEMYETNPFGNRRFTSEFSAVVEADGYAVQQIWLQNYGVSSGAFYDDVTNGFTSNARLTVNYLFPLPVFDIVR